jgi:membrane protease subunit (stomatin/prohibitin family)
MKRPDMKAMDGDGVGLVSRAEFMAAIGQLWQAQAAQMKARGDKMSREPVCGPERTLGRALDASAEAP